MVMTVTTMTGRLDPIKLNVQKFSAELLRNVDDVSIKVFIRF